MALKGGAIPLGATYGPTGGTSKTLVDLGFDRTGGLLLVDDSSAQNVRLTIEPTIKASTANADFPGGQTANRRKLTIKRPIVLADESVFVQQATIEFVLHPESSGANVDELQSVAAACISDADFDAFWNNGSLA